MYKKLVGAKAINLFSYTTVGCTRRNMKEGKSLRNYFKIQFLLLPTSKHKMALLNTGMISADTGTGGQGDTGIMVPALVTKSSRNYAIPIR